jgi:hypothetical protein
MGRDPHHEPIPVLWDSVRVAASTRDCFADEIAIDFPSVNPLVERVRAAFLGERPGVDTLTTEIALSRREAALGVVVSLDVPIRAACDACGGRGEVWTDLCTACRGTGDALEHHPVKLSVPRGVLDGARFRLRVASTPVQVTIRLEFHNPH